MSLALRGGLLLKTSTNQPVTERAVFMVSIDQWTLAQVATRQQIGRRAVESTAKRSWEPILLLGATKLPGKQQRLVCTAPTLPSVLRTSVVFDVQLPLINSNYICNGMNDNSYIFVLPPYLTSFVLETSELAKLSVSDEDSNKFIWSNCDVFWKFSAEITHFVWKTPKG